MKFSGLKESKGEQNASVLIAAKPNRTRDGLYILLKTLSGIDIVGPANDSSSALHMVCEHHPALVLLDTNLPGEEVTTVLKQVKVSGAQSRCLVLTDNFGQRKKAYTAGADAVLIKGSPAIKLFEIIERLL